MAGCGKLDPPQFRSNILQLVNKDVQPAQQKEIALALAAMFGTPDEPFVLPESGLDINKIRLAAGAVYGSELKQEHGLYRRHCVHCHGTTGDGMGPTAAILNPYPRDYRQGLFKFKSTVRDAKPTEHDLERIVREGIMGTAMPSFNLLSDDEILALVEYVKYLSMRGQAELSLMNAVTDLGENEALKLDRELLIENTLQPIALTWAEAKTKIIAPPAPDDSDLVKSETEGRELFYGKAGCVKCHGISELGDGQTTDYDDWNKAVFEIEKEVKSAGKSTPRLTELAAILANDVLPPRTITPRNLRQPYYRFGRRPLDLYRRVHAGINGAPMPGVAQASPGAAGLSPEEIWNVVHYVESLPYEAISRPPRGNHNSTAKREQM